MVDKVGKGPSHAKDTVLSPCGDLEGPFRGWLHGIHRPGRYLKHRGEGLKRSPSAVLRRAPRDREDGARPPRKGPTPLDRQQT
jgi:hypothetical protein